MDERRTGGFLGVLIYLIAAVGIITALYAVRAWWLPPLASAEGAQVDRLMGVFFVLIAIVFVGVHVVLGTFVMRHAASGDRRASYWHENSRLELTWTVVPAAILVLLTIASGVTWVSLRVSPAAAAAASPAVAVEVTAQQFGWYFRYPGPDGRFGRLLPTAVSRDNPLGIDPQDPAGADDIVKMNEMVLPAGRPVQVSIRSKDVIHSFFVPQFRVKQDAVPGRTIEVTFTPTEPGNYEIACAELCGVGHYVMRSPLKVMPETEFEAWLAQQGKTVTARS